MPAELAPFTQKHCNVVLFRDSRTQAKVPANHSDCFLSRRDRVLVVIHQLCHSGFIKLSHPYRKPNLEPVRVVFTHGRDQLSHSSCKGLGGAVCFGFNAAPGGDPNLILRMQM